MSSLDCWHALNASQLNTRIAKRSVPALWVSAAGWSFSWKSSGETHPQVRKEKPHTEPPALPSGPPHPQFHQLAPFKPPPRSDKPRPSPGSPPTTAAHSAARAPFGPPTHFPEVTHGPRRAFLDVIRCCACRSVAPGPSLADSLAVASRCPSG